MADAEELEPGVRDHLVTRDLERSLSQVEAELISQISVDASNAADRFALHVSEQLVRAIESRPDGEQTEFGVSLTTRIIELIGEATGNVDEFDQ